MYYICLFYSGNVGNLLKEGYPVYATDLTACIVERGFPIKFYEHFVAGPISHVEEPYKLTRITYKKTKDHEDIQEEEENNGDFRKYNPIRIGKFDAQIIDTPGHSKDQIAFYIKKKGWLFSGDSVIYIPEKAGLGFRADEDYDEHIQTLQTLSKMNISALFCGHFPSEHLGEQKIREKLKWLQEAKERIHYLYYKQGLSIYEIQKQVIPRGGSFFPRFFY